VHIMDTQNKNHYLDTLVHSNSRCTHLNFCPRLLLYLLIFRMGLIFQFY